MDVLNWCLVAIMDWVKGDKFKLNLNKTEILLVGGSSDQLSGVRPVSEGTGS